MTFMDSNMHFLTTMIFENYFDLVLTAGIIGYIIAAGYHDIKGNRHNEITSTLCAILCAVLLLN